MSFVPIAEETEKIVSVNRKNPRSPRINPRYDRKTQALVRKPKEW